MNSMIMTCSRAVHEASSFVAVLAFGIINLYRGDEKARSRSNKLMRLRIVLQFSAILIIIAIFLVRQNFGG